MTYIRPDGAPSSFAQMADWFDGRGRGDGDDLDAPASPPPESPPRTSQFFCASDLDGLPVPSREWLVPDLIPSRTVTILGGNGGTGKSLLALQLAVAAAGGGRWLGQEVASGDVVFLSAEDDKDELHRRLADIVAAEGIRLRDLPRLTLRSVAGEDALLAVETATALTTTTLYAELEAAAVEREVRLIVVDTLADCYPANENDRAKARRFIGLLRGLAIRQRCAVVLLAHPSLTGLSSGTGTSGSTAWNNSVRSRLYFERIKDADPSGKGQHHEPDPDLRRLSTKKVNYGSVGGELMLRWTDGVFVTDQGEAQATGLDRMAALARAERVVLKLLDEFTAQGRRVNHQGSGTHAPKLFAAHSKAEGLTKRALAAAMEALMSKGTLTVQTEGPPSRRVSFLARAAP